MHPSDTLDCRIYNRYTLCVPNSSYSINIPPTIYFSKIHVTFS